jgi:hypothetical protein
MAAINTLRLARLAPSEPTETFSVARTDKIGEPSLRSSDERRHR